LSSKRDEITTAAKDAFIEALGDNLTPCGASSQ
jgi:hypothetical protein